MYAGRLVETAPASELYRGPRHPYSLGLLHSFPSLHGPRLAMTGIPGSPPDLRQLPAGCVFHPRCPYVMDRCRTDEPPLSPVGPGAPAVGTRPRAGCRTRPSRRPPNSPEPSGPAGPADRRERPDRPYLPRGADHDRPEPGADRAGGRPGSRCSRRAG